MTTCPRLLDLFCGAGGAARGYQMVGFHVTGIDNRPMPRYAGDVFIQADALDYAAEHGHEYDAIHASPPCQRYSRTKVLNSNSHPDLIGRVRELLSVTGRHYVIENVPGAPLTNPVTLVGTLFGLMTKRARLFECSFPVDFVLAPPIGKQTKMGRPPKPGEYIPVVGHVINIAACRAAMGIDWMTGDELSQAIPPAYTAYIGAHLLKVLA